MKRTTKVYNTRADEHLESLIASFRPRFGNQTDIAILEAYSRLKHDLGEINASEMRQLELKKLESQMTKKMKDVRMKEKNIIHQIMRRNKELL